MAGRRTVPNLGTEVKEPPTEAKVLHPLALKHHRHVRVDADLTPDIEDYL